MKVGDKLKTFFRNCIRNNKFSIVIASLIVIGFTINEVMQRVELSSNSVTTIAKIKTCKRIYYAGRWFVEIEYKSLAGDLVSRTATLYKLEDCSAGKEIKIRYSLESDLFEVLE